MLKMIALLISLIPMISHAQEISRQLSCTGFVTEETGNMAGKMTVTFLEGEDGNWYLELWEKGMLDPETILGPNTSSNSSVIAADSYSTFFCSGAWFEYDLDSNTINFAYKYRHYEGCQRTGGFFTDCSLSR